MRNSAWWECTHCTHYTPTQRSWTLATPSPPTILHLFSLRLFDSPPTSVDYKSCVLNALFFSVHPLFFLPFRSTHSGVGFTQLLFSNRFLYSGHARLFLYKRVWLLPLLQSSFYIRLIFILCSFSLFSFRLVLFSSFSILFQHRLLGLRYHYFGYVPFFLIISFILFVFCVSLRIVVSSDRFAQ